MDEETLGLTRLLLARLERISADSVWAHRASGIRGALLRVLDQSITDRQTEQQSIDRLVELGFEILELAATDINGSSSV